MMCVAGVTKSEPALILEARRAQLDSDIKQDEQRIRESSKRLDEYRERIERRKEWIAEIDAALKVLGANE